MSGARRACNYHWSARQRGPNARLQPNARRQWPATKQDKHMCIYNIYIYIYHTHRDIRTDRQTDIPTYIHTYIHTYLHTFHTYLHTYLHTYIHTYHTITYHNITLHYHTIHYITDITHITYITHFTYITHITQITYITYFTYADVYVYINMYIYIFFGQRLLHGRTGSTELMCRPLRRVTHLWARAKKNT